MNEDLPLGRETSYPDRYSPGLLYVIPRAESRSVHGIGAILPFRGVDVWNAWELTWLDPNGMPHSATAEFRVPADSPNLVESKSLKLYLNSFAMTPFASRRDVAESIEQDLTACSGADVKVELHGAEAPGDVSALPGDCLDTLQVACGEVGVDPTSLRASAGGEVSECLHTHLLRSLCPVTRQPDHGSVLVTYTGPRIDRKGLLQYIVSYRRHEDFHESCVERMFVDILARCRPSKLTVYARYLRRGGIDINPFRSTHEDDAPNLRLWRQ